MEKKRENIIIATGNLGIGGQEKMLTEFLKLLSPERYNTLLLVEEDKGEENHYMGEIPSHVQVKFLTTLKFMESVKKYQKRKDFLSKLIYSHLLKRKKALGIDEMKKYLGFSDTIIDYNMGLLRHLHKLDLKGKRVIAWSHAGEGGLERKKQKRKNMGLYDTIIVLNSQMEKGFKKNYPQEKFQVVKIYNFMEEESIRLKSEAFQVEEKAYIVTVGSLTENKNQKLTISAFKKITEKMPDVNLLILGEGPMKDTLEKYVKELNIEKKVKFLGLQQNPYPYVKNAKFYVQSSLQEGMPLVIMEAMILGKAVLSTKNSGAIEILQDGKYGVLVEQNSESMAEQMLNLLQNSKRINELEKLSLERSQDFSREIAEKAIEKIIRKS